MTPNPQFVTINDNLNKIKNFITEIIIKPRHSLTKWAKITNQTPAAKIGYIGQHLASLVTGIQGTGTGARGDDLADHSEVKSCNKVDQVDKCKDCDSRVLRMEKYCSFCGSQRIKRRNDSKWLFSVRDEQELNQYLNLDRIVLLLMDYPKFEENDYNDIRISIFEIYPKEERMKVFNELLSNHYYKIFKPKQQANQKTNPMNLHPWSFQFYKCNPIQTFECIIENIDKKPIIVINKDNYITPLQDRNEDLQPLAMPTTLLKQNEWEELLEKASFDDEIKPFLNEDFMKELKNDNLTKEDFCKLPSAKKAQVLPYLNVQLKKHISLRPIVSVRQKTHYQRV